MPGEQSLTLGRADDVIGRGDHERRVRDGCGVVTQCTEGTDLGHRTSSGGTQAGSCRDRSHPTIAATRTPRPPLGGGGPPPVLASDRCPCRVCSVPACRAPGGGLRLCRDHAAVADPGRFPGDGRPNSPSAASTSIMSCPATPAAPTRCSRRPRVSFDASGLDQASKVRVHLFVFADRATLRPAAADDRCLRALLRDRPGDLRVGRALAVRAGRPGPVGPDVRDRPARRPDDRRRDGG